ncbi:sulfoxide reductase heme-binding subunit YedZ [Laribacter hongkongensis]|uniref:Protein-methionine-sulfoxide reductase heme-binding subunit MsrQ n=1 Tax=Laribacter hongkongensis TaxID=168471 RepID=A0A248LLU4_9NEIS|nr:protein-methionine-sulfoxide reductase heme-binding subunit MsrQ [Laribacter hongkongensis]ASJ25133.1 protein-methionine-sulfoxide reductase heme-binding subunit MsrQ [Laribacter hongkongensis]MBE5530210.1 sulfoxide reductase heme-binding subunit YedZ [Laribacter hongkongensis]MCG8992091.1 sulfoxide reductase heme-binding subunit YedZ [Laribacter hongkongensis]MCG8998610.1 sulfoxide reductase heme-binding subunit YedZ [Laribacter hongkongensis]MCG9002148.1 sulfoxide reductase heme-binding s
MVLTTGWRQRLPAWAPAVVFGLCLVPAGLTGFTLWQGLAADPADYLTRQSGWWALALLLLTLLVRPLAHHLHWPALMRLRRQLGLWSFAWAVVHFAVYLLLSGGEWPVIADDIRKSPYIVLGFAAFLLLLPLALTSTRAAMRRLGKNWQRLHRLVYAAAILAAWHFWWLTKSDLREPALFAGGLTLLLAWRIWRSGRKAVPRRAGDGRQKP